MSKVMYLVKSSVRNNSQDGSSVGCPDDTKDRNKGGYSNEFRHFGGELMLDD